MILRHSQRRARMAADHPDPASCEEHKFVVVSDRTLGVSKRDRADDRQRLVTSYLDHIYKVIRGFEFTSPGKGGIVESLGKRYAGELATRGRVWSRDMTV
jgi:hypothetical protein